SDSSGLTADLTSPANQPVIALLTWQVTSSSPQPPVPGSNTAPAAGTADRDAGGGAAGTVPAATVARASATHAAGRAGPGRAATPATATARRARAAETRTAPARTAARTRPGPWRGPARRGARGSLIRQPGTSGRSR